jgi:hypothetical protein
LGNTRARVLQASLSANLGGDEIGTGRRNVVARFTLFSKSLVAG